MRDDTLGCGVMRCPRAQGSYTTGYWCCEGCDDLGCCYRCQNNRLACGSGTDRPVRPRELNTWSKREIELLTYGYGTMSVKELRQELPHKTVGELYRQALRLGLKKR